MVSAASGEAALGERYVPPIDGLRGFAALTIVVLHSWTVAGYPGEGGVLWSLLGGSNMAIDVFFVISGFVLFLPTVLDGEFGSVRKYARRRWARVGPAYYAALFGALLLWPLTDKLDWEHAFPLANVGGWVATALHLVFAQTFVLGPFGQQSLGNPYLPGWGINVVVWTLTVEVCFYAALPLVADRYLRRPFAALVIALVATLAFRAGCHHLGQAFDFGDPARQRFFAALGEQQLRSSLPGVSCEFAVGMTAAFSYARLRRHEAASRLVLAALSVVAASALLLYVVWRTGHELYLDRGHPTSRFAVYLNEPLVGVAFGVVLLAIALYPHSLGAPWASRPARWYGTRSYGIYLWHLPVVLVVSRLLQTGVGETARFVVLLLVTIPVSAGLGALSWALLERPAIARARKMTGSARPLA